jgi:hypothetical protein
LGKEPDDTSGEVAEGKNLGEIGFRQFDREFFFDGEDEFQGGHRIEGVHAEIFDEAVVGMEAGEVEREVRGEEFA